MKSNICQLSVLFSVILGVSTVLAHDGRRFDISLIDGQLVARGYNNGTPDGADSVRPYANSLHDHFSFFGSESNPIGFADLPSWDIGTIVGSDISALIGHEISLRLVDSGKWVNIPTQDGTGVNQDFGTPELVTFSRNDLQENGEDLIQIGFDGQVVDTLNKGNIQLQSSVSGVTQELDFEYFVSNHNSMEIYFIEWKLSTTAPDVQESESIYTILSPGGMGPVERLHFQSLYLEQHFGTQLDAVLLGDVNRDGVVNLLDVQPFVNLLSIGSYQAEADANEDGVVDLLDVQLFVELLSA